MGPLGGIRVIDLTAVVLGPIATQILADYGAEVIKVEPLTGDLMRANGVARNKGMSSTFMNLNRNKKSVAVNLKSKAGLAAIKALIATADVLVHNMRTKAIGRLGLGYEAIRQINPGIIYCAATGYADDGAYAGRPAFDEIIQAASGLAGLLEQESGRPGYFPSLVADKVAGIVTANAVLGALVYKGRTGEGQYVEVPMFETMVAFTMTEHMGGQGFVPPEGPAGYGRLLKGGRQPCPTKDGYVALLPYTENHWVAFFSSQGRTDLLEKYDLGNRHERNRRIHELYDDLRATTRQCTTKELIDICGQLDIPVTPIYTIDNICEHEHARSVGLFQEYDHPTEGKIRTIRPTTRFSATPSAIERPAPGIGADTEEVLASVGLSPEDIERACE